MNVFDRQGRWVDERPGDEMLPPLFEAASHPLTRCGDIGAGLWQSDDGGALEDRLVELVDGAEQLVCLCTFLFALPCLDEALRRAAQRGVRVYVLTASGNRLDAELRVDDEFGAKTRREHAALLDRLAGRVLVRSADHFHAKFVLVDPHTAPRGLLFTCNLTREAIRRNTELAVELVPRAARALFGHFCHAFWEQAEHTLLEPGRLVPVEPARRFDPPVPDKQVHVTAPGRTHLRDVVLRIIQRARSQLIIACFGWDHPDVISAIEARLAAGVTVTLLVRPRPAVIPALVRLEQAGAAILGHRWLHAKALWSPEGGSLVMTANLAVHGLDSGFEVGVALPRDAARRLGETLAEWADAGQPFAAAARVREVLGDVVVFNPGPSKLTIVNEQTIDYGVITASTVGDIAGTQPTRWKTPDAKEKARRVVHTWYVKAPRLSSGAKRIEPEPEPEPNPEVEPEASAPDDADSKPAKPKSRRRKTPDPFPIYKEPGKRGKKVVVVDDPRRIDEAEAFAREVGAARVVVEE